MFDLSSTHKTTFSGGSLVPIGIWENIPGDTFSLSINSVIEMTTPLKPTMDLAVCNVYAFKVPLRILWEHFKEMFGENEDTYWTQPTEYTVPTLTAPEGGWNKDSIMTHLGIRQGVETTVSALPARAIAKIYNDWFRDENVMTPAFFTNDDTNRTGNNGDNYITDLYLGGKCPRIAKFHDLFTTALPGPIKSTEDVLLPLGTTAPVQPIQSETNPNFRAAPFFDIVQSGTSANPVNLKTNELLQLRGIDINGTNLANNAFIGGDLINPNGYFVWSNQSKGSPGLEVNLANAAGATMQDFIYAYNLYKMFTIDARGGTRYTEILANHYGVVSSDARLQRSEYLGGTNFEIDMVHVPQTSQTTENSAQGYLTAYSNTAVKNKHLFTTSYEEHCYTIVLAAIRTKQSYAQGNNKMWYHFDRTDFYMPTFAHIGEQPIRNRELYAQGIDEDNQIFGYAEAWYEYRQGVDLVTGEFSPDAENSLPSYTYVNNFDSLPTLSADFILESPNNIDRTIAIDSDVQDQFKADFYFNVKAARPMPARSIPSLASHF